MADRPAVGRAAQQMLWRLYSICFRCSEAAREAFQLLQRGKNQIAATKKTSWSSRYSLVVAITTGEMVICSIADPYQIQANGPIVPEMIAAAAIILEEQTTKFLAQAGIYVFNWRKK